MGGWKELRWVDEMAYLMVEQMVDGKDIKRAVM